MTRELQLLRFYKLFSHLNEKKKKKKKKKKKHLEINVLSSVNKESNRVLEADLLWPLRYCLNPEKKHWVRLPGENQDVTIKICFAKLCFAATMNTSLNKEPNVSVMSLAMVQKLFLVFRKTLLTTLRFVCFVIGS